MTKTLTEQWKDGELPQETFYWKKGKEYWTASEYEMRDYLYVRDIRDIHCIATVPSYDEYKRLQEQLNEANKALKQLVGFGVVTEETKAEYEDPDDWECTDVAQEYLDKWGVK